ncbi:hypothetical protein V5O48_014982 [Marasmius crinis-equi]|uniref:beta-glucosidase n=1 Tax=Marasmius crinis-equi TaxID=585013 RepID=A0ABR3EVS2_9AGAR
MRALLASVNDAEGLNTLMMTLPGWATSDTPRCRVRSYDFFAMFCEVPEMDSSLYRVDWSRQLASSVEDFNVDVHTAAQRTLDIFVKSVPKDELEPLVFPLRRTTDPTGFPCQHVEVPGFSLPEGITLTVPIIIAGFTTGTKEHSSPYSYMGEEHRGTGANIALGPMMNIGRIAQGGRNWEGFDADPFLTHEAAYETIIGMQQTGIQACVDHGYSKQEHKRTMSSSIVDDRTAHEIYAHPFLRSVVAGVASVMCSYSLNNGIYACEDDRTMNQILKNKYGFQGCSFTPDADYLRDYWT